VCVRRPAAHVSCGCLSSAGAFNLDGGMLRGRTLLNLDTEDWGDVFIGCAGVWVGFGGCTMSENGWGCCALLVQTSVCALRYLPCPAASALCCTAAGINAGSGNGLARTAQLSERPRTML